MLNRIDKLEKPENFKDSFINSTIVPTISCGSPNPKKKVTFPEKLESGPEEPKQNAQKSSKKSGKMRKSRNNARKTAQIPKPILKRTIRH